MGVGVGVGVSIPVYLYDMKLFFKEKNGLCFINTLPDSMNIAYIRQF